MKILIIPARGGSKGIKLKNLQRVNGVTLVERAIRTAKKANLDQIIVSTDNPEIMRIATSYGVLVHQRSNQTSQDQASTESVILEVIKDYDETWNSDAILGFLQVTSPFVSYETINECFNFAEQGYSAFSATVFHGFIWDRDIKWMPVNHPIDKRLRRQDLTPMVMESGAIYCFPLEKFKLKNYRFCAEAMPVLESNLNSLQIDTPQELLLANLLAVQYETLPKIEFYPKPKILITDFDGCLTNDKVKVNLFGKETVIVNRKDGLAVKRLGNLGIRVVIATSETNKVVEVRAKKMKVEVLLGLEDKVSSITKYLNDQGLSWEDIWYIGNDVNDLGSIEKAAVSFCPIDAAPQIFNVAKVVLSRRGGEGLLSEIASRLESVNK